MFHLIRTILCIASLFLFVALLIAWPLAHSTPIGLWYRQTESVALPAYTAKTPHHYFFTISGNELALGDWRIPKVIYATRLELEALRNKVRYLSQFRIDKEITPDGISPTNQIAISLERDRQAL